MADIQEEYPTWRELVQAIGDVEYAPPTIAEFTRELQNVTQSLAKEKSKLKQLELSTQKEFKDWVMIRDRASKRLWVKIKHPSSHTEKLTDLEAKEEKEYLQAFAAEQETKARIDVLDGETKSLQAQLDSLHPLASKCKEYKAQLASLYKRVFAGHTPAFPEEDRAEAVVADAEREDYAAQTSLTNETRAQSLVGDVLKMLELASANMREAESASNWDRVGGGMMMDMMERSAIAQAQNCVDRARLISTQAESLSPGIGTLSHLQMPQGNLMSDMLFDNYFTDTAFHYKIQAANGLLLRARATVQSQTLATVQQRVRDAQASKQRAGAALFAAREALERLRSDIMATQGGTASIPTAAPPTYAR